MARPRHTHVRENGPLRAPTLRSVGDDELVRGLRDGDETAFSEVINAYHPSMVRLAQSSSRTAP